MSQASSDVDRAILEIRDLLRLLAEPAIDARDKALRSELRRIVGTSAQRARAVLLMDGTRNQSVICTESGMAKGNLSTLVKNLTAAKLLNGEGKQPTLAISIPANFFEADANAD